MLSLSEELICERLDLRSYTFSLAGRSTSRPLLMLPLLALRAARFFHWYALTVLQSYSYLRSKRSKSSFVRNNLYSHAWTVVYRLQDLKDFKGQG